MNKNDFDIEELTYEVSILLEGVLYFAGVKKSNLKKACEVYIDMVDEILDNNTELSGVDEVIAVVDEMKKTHKELFN